MAYQYNQFSQSDPYGSLSPLAVAASDRRARALGGAQADAGRASAALTQAGGNPFAAAREAQRGYVAQAGQANVQASQEMAQIAAQATQQRLAEEERKRQDAERWLGAGLSAAGSVLGNVLVPGIGGALGGAAGSALGGGQPQQAARPPMMVQPRAAVPAQPAPPPAAPMTPPGSQGGASSGYMGQSAVSPEDLLRLRQAGFGFR